MTDLLCLVAGGFTLPRIVLERLRADGRPVFVLALTGDCDPATVVGFDHIWLRFEDAIDRAFAEMHARGICQLVLAGKVSRSALLKKLLFDSSVSDTFLSRLATSQQGDNQILRLFAEEVARKGFSLVSIPDIAPDLMLRPGLYTREGPDKTQLADIDLGVQVSQQIGALDIGHAVVIADGWIMGVEAAEGTNAMIERCGELLRHAGANMAGACLPSTRMGVLVKMSKPGQSLSLDPPVIGAETVACAARAGLAGIAGQAGGLIMAEREEMVRIADREGLFIQGIDSGLAAK